MPLSRLRLAMPLPSIPFRVPLLPSFPKWRRKQLVITAALNRIKIATIRQREILPAGQPQRVKMPQAPATKAAIQNPTQPNSTLENLEEPDSEPAASPAHKATELPIIDPDLEPPDENHYPLLIGTGRDKRQIVAATRRAKRRSKDSKKSSTPRTTFGAKTVVRRPTKRLSPLQTEQEIRLRRKQPTRNRFAMGRGCSWRATPAGPVARVALRTPSLWAPSRS